MAERTAAQHSVTGLQQDIGLFTQWLNSQNYNFHTVSPSSHAAYLARCNKTEATHLRDIFGWSLPFAAHLLPEAIFKLLVKHQLISRVIGQPDSLWQSRIRVSGLNEALFIHSAYPTTQDNAVFFGPDTYRFIYALRQYLVAKQPNIQRAIELCSGAAPAAVTLARHAPKAEVIAADINPLALQYAALNAQCNGVSNMRTVCSNLYQQIDGQFDFITANPPYLVDTEQRLYRHGGELMGAALSVDIVQASLDHLAINGTLLLYTGVVIAEGKDLFYQALQALMASRYASFSMQYEEIDPDIFADELNEAVYPDAERIAAVVLTIERLK